MNTKRVTPLRLRKLVDAATKASSELAAALVAEAQAADPMIADKAAIALRMGAALYCGVVWGSRPAVEVGARDTDGTLLRIATIPLQRDTR